MYLFLYLFTKVLVKLVFIVPIFKKGLEKAKKEEYQAD